ncbi:MAG: hypothetical protein IPM54_13490 [Polyangiaceae bacterium]|nr:hypothetical protein [Polyangiaceae bacterium]
MSEVWSSFRERIEGLSDLPKFVVREVDEIYVAGCSNMGSSESSVRIADSSDW